MFIDHIVGDVEFEYHAGQLVLSFKGGNSEIDGVVDVCLSQWVSESLQSAVIRALDVILASSVPKDSRLTGVLHQGAE